MSTKRTISTRFYSYVSFETFETKIAKLLSQIPLRGELISIAIFSEGNNIEYHEAMRIIRNAAKERFKTPPLLTYVVQPLPLPEEVAAEVYISRASKENVEFNTAPNGVRYAKIRAGRERKSDYMYIVEGIAASSFTDSMREQSQEVCGKISTLLQHLNLTPSAIIRQWNYIGNITATRAGEQNYQAFNDIRSELYSSDKWEKGYPAATGIGSSCDGLVVCLALYDGDQEYAIDNPQQISAHTYNERLLVGDCSKATPKFERAKCIIFDNMSACLISGTAAICGEESIQSEDIVAQTLQTIENIEVLISDENMAANNCPACSLEPFILRIYVKHRKDFNAVRRVVEARWGSVAQVYLEADVCRSELLVEIEGVAKGGVR